jgi:hypothetical protein
MKVTAIPLLRDAFPVVTRLSSLFLQSLFQQFPFQQFARQEHRSHDTGQLPRRTFGPPSARHRRVDKGGRGVNAGHGAYSAVPTTVLLVGTAGLVPRINR